MIKFCALYSGSSGNSYFVEIDGTKLLIDAGTSAKKIKEALISIGEKIENIHGVLITHEHSDHIKGLKVLLKKQDIPIYTTNKTFKELISIYPDLEQNPFIPFKAGDKFKINNTYIKSIKVSHDAIDPVAFCFKDSKENKIAILTDLGYISEGVYQTVIGSKLVLLESNYETNILQVSDYPSYLKRRILGEYGHLSNTNASDFAKELIKNGTQTIILGHLSLNTNTEKIAYQNMKNAIISTLNLEIEKDINTEKDILKENNITLQVAKRDCVGELHIIE